MPARTIRPILLAAGQSQRFGSDKLVHPFVYKSQIKPLIMHTLSSWLEVFSELDVVIRDDNSALITLVKNSELAAKVKLILATDASKGMSASLISGVAANQQADGWLIGLADMPFINRAVINDSLLALQAGAKITQPQFQQRSGHPVGFASDFLPALLSLSGDKGARQILKAAYDQITVINSPDDGIYRDIDVKHDLD